MKRLLFLLVSAVAALLGLFGFSYAVRAQAVAPTETVYYVDAVNGSNSNDGSEAAPWRTISWALGHVPTNGVTLHVLPGVYDTALGETFPLTLTPGMKLLGTLSSTTVISGQAGVPDIWVGRTSADVLDPVWIKNLMVRGGDRGFYMRGSDLYTTTVHVENVLVQENSQGIEVLGGSVITGGGDFILWMTNTEVLSNTETGIRVNSTSYYTSARGPYVKVNLSHGKISENGTDGILILGGANSTFFAVHEVAVEDTVIADNHYAGIRSGVDIWGTVIVRVDRSWLLRNANAGYWWNAQANYTTAYAYITNSVVAGNNVGIRTSWQIGGGTWVVNSTVVSNTQAGIVWYSNYYHQQPISVTNSIIWNPGAPDLAYHNYGWSEQEVSYSDIGDGTLNGVNGNFSADPHLTADYRPGLCAAVVDAANSNLAPAVDIYGKPRSIGTAPDLGAIEVNLPCPLKISQAIPVADVVFGDRIDYTATLTNSLTMTPLEVLLTQPLTSGLIYDPQTLWASKGEVTLTQDAVSWTGVLSPGEVISVGISVTSANLGEITNVVYVDAGEWESYASEVVTTNVLPHYTFLPHILKNSLICREAIYDDFSDPESGWPIGQTSAWRYSYVNGEYGIYSRLERVFTALRAYRAENWTGLSLDVRQDTATPVGSLGFLYDASDDWSRFYTFEVDPVNGDFVVWLFADGGWHLHLNGRDPTIGKPPYSTHLEIRRAFGRAELCINGHSITSTPADRTMAVGVVVSARNFAYEARFDNYTVNLTCLNTPAMQGTTHVPDAGICDAGTESLPPSWIQLSRPTVEEALRAQNAEPGALKALQK